MKGDTNVVPQIPSFVNVCPVCVQARATLEHLFDLQQLDKLFVRTAEKQYTRTLPLLSLIEMTLAVVLCVEPAFLAAHPKLKEPFAVTDPGNLQQAPVDGIGHLSVKASLRAVYGEEEAA